MTTERDDWKPRNNNGQSGGGYNRERRPYQNDRNNNNYGENRWNNNYGNDDRDGSYGRQSSNRGNYSRSGQGYDRPQNNNYGNYERNNEGYERNSYKRPSDDGDGVKKRRPRVGESQPSQRSYGDRNNSQGGYDNSQREYDNPQRGRDNYQSRGGYGNSQQNRGGYNNSYNRGGYNNSQGEGYNNNYQQRDGRNNQQRRPQQGRPYNNRPQRNNDYDPNAKYSIQKQLKYREENFDPNEPLRLNKYLANAGVCSRREADEFIQVGLIKVNGEVVKELGTKVKRADVVSFHDQPVTLEQKVYVLLNKPKNCVTTADDPQERLTVMDLVKNACHERIVPVGRLDRNTTGVLLLTNDGDLASKLTHPKYLKKKIYHVWLDKNITEDDMQRLVEGIELEDGEIHVDAISYVTEEDRDQVGVEIHSGRNRIVRRMFESLGYRVERLDRVYFAGLTKKNLRKGQWRYLSEKEVSMLRMGAFD